MILKSITINYIFSVGKKSAMFIKMTLGDRLNRKRVSICHPHRAGYAFLYISEIISNNPLNWYKFSVWEEMTFCSILKHKSFLKK